MLTMTKISLQKKKKYHQETCNSLWSCFIRKVSRIFAALISSINIVIDLDEGFLCRLQFNRLWEFRNENCSKMRKILISREAVYWDFSAAFKRTSRQFRRSNVMSRKFFAIAENLLLVGGKKWSRWVVVITHNFRTRRYLKDFFNEEAFHVYECTARVFFFKDYFKEIPCATQAWNFETKFEKLFKEKCFENFLTWGSNDGKINFWKSYFAFISNPWKQHLFVGLVNSFISFIIFVHLF